MSLAPRSATADVTILHSGYVGDRVASTVGLVVDGRTVIVIDPGMVAGRERILEPLAAAGFSPEQVTDVVFSHHHPDHTLNAALFPAARFHDHWAIYRDDSWTPRPAHGFEVSPSVRLMETPGHTPQDITTLVGTAEEIVAFTHLWWHAAGPAEDPYASDAAALHRNRSAVLEIAGRIVPGHGEAFRADASTVR